MARMSAKSAAMRDFRRDKDYAIKKDDDMVASKDDQAAAKRNIIMQLRKARDVNGNLAIQFQDGKSKKLAVQTIDKLLSFHDKLKPDAKLKFAQQVGQSYARAVAIGRMKLESKYYD